MKEELSAVAHELKRLRESGAESVYLSDATLERLQKWSEQYRGSRRMERGDEGRVRIASEDLPILPVGNGGNSVGSSAKKLKESVEVPSPPIVRLEGESKLIQWESLRERVLSDRFCQSQVKDGKKVVFGVGHLDADIFFCGEAPGAEEEDAGEPFVGPAGQLLTKIIGAMGLKREDVYIGNIMSYRPPMDTPYGNRPPTHAEMEYCMPFLLGQLAIVRPKVIVALGKTAVDGLLGPDSKRRMGAIRGKWFDFQGTPLIPTFHPSYIIRKNDTLTKRQVWEDLLQVMEKLEMPISEKQRGFFRI